MYFDIFIGPKFLNSLVNQVVGGDLRMKWQMAVAQDLIGAVLYLDG